MLALHMMPCVCPSVCPSQAGTNTKTAKHKITQTTSSVQGLQFSVAKNLGEIPTWSVTPNRGCQTDVESVKSGDVRPISRYISETVQVM